MAPSLVCGYQGETTYRVNGREYDVRYRAPNYLSDKPERYAEIVSHVGTVRRRDRFTEFPPADVVALFPDYVGARYNRDENTTEYAGRAPRLLKWADGWVAYDVELARPDVKVEYRIAR